MSEELTKRAMILQGINVVKDNDYWSSREITWWVQRTYGVTVEDGYVNAVRKSTGTGWKQGMDKKVKTLMQDMLNQMP